ncbi:hypothetical protein CW304_28765 [Bacillus sp. UFRGS-B20]|nr:hypothetical protein CW304_28765 [Bacillus sp. UFRGS-B20]
MLLHFPRGPSSIFLYWCGFQPASWLPLYIIPPAHHFELFFPIFCLVIRSSKENPNHPNVLFLLLFLIGLLRRKQPLLTLFP